MPPRGRQASSELEQRLRRWAELTELGLGLRGGMLLGPRAVSWTAAVRAGLAEANRHRRARAGG